LNGAASALISQAPAGQTGSAQGYAYTEISGIELNPSGSLLAVCDSFNDLLRLYDTTTRVEIAAVPVGDFPIRVAFNPAGTRAYVTNAFGDSVSVVAISGASSSNIATVSGIEFPLVVNVDAVGAYVYVGNTDANSPLLYVIDASTNAALTTTALTAPARDSHYVAADGLLYLILNDGALAQIKAAGPATSALNFIPLTSAPSDLAFADAANMAVVAQPIPDGIDIIDFGGQLPCPSDIAPQGQGDGAVNIDDLLLVISNWNAVGPNPADVNGNGLVDIDDLLAVISAWGPCP
jgi:YVTN family beta-propeller protein